MCVPVFVCASVCVLRVNVLFFLLLRACACACVRECGCAWHICMFACAQGILYICFLSFFVVFPPCACSFVPLFAYRVFFVFISSLCLFICLLIRFFCIYFFLVLVCFLIVFFCNCFFPQTARPADLESLTKAVGMLRDLRGRMTKHCIDAYESIIYLYLFLLLFNTCIFCRVIPLAPLAFFFPVLCCCLIARPHDPSIALTCMLFLFSENISYLT